MTSDDCDRFSNCTRSANPLHWSVRLCPATPIKGAQTVESFIGANRNGVVCLLGVGKWQW